MIESQTFLSRQHLVAPVIGLGLLLAAGCSAFGTGSIFAGTAPDAENGPASPKLLDPNGGTDPSDPGSGEPQGDPTNSGCVSDRIDAPSGQHCTCSFDTCDASSLDCTCDLSCYADADCLIGSDGSSTDGLLGSCSIACTPEDDLSTDMTCSATDCEPTPSSTSINPTASPASPTGSSSTMDRSPQNVGVLFVIDNSGSMADDQNAAACAMDSFFQAAGQNGASYQTGVITTDMVGQAEGASTTYTESGDYVGAPEFVGVDGTCTVAPVCACGTDQTPPSTTCNLTPGGDWIQSDAPGAQAQMEQLIVQGNQGSNKEGGLEQAFQFLAQMEKDGTFATQAPKEIVVISDENANADEFLCPFDAVDRNTAGIPSFNPPTPQNTTGSCQADLINFYVYYFTSRGIIVHGINYTADCASSSSEEIGAIYLAVIQATGGHSASICHCESFGSFFDNVGQTTSDLSTSLCFDGVTPDPSTLQVTYTEGGASIAVPPSATDGWVYDPSLNCIVFSGTWLDKFGSFEVDYVDQNAPPPPPTTSQACMDAGIDPLLGSIGVTCGGVDVPESATNGWTFDPVTDCFTFHGAYAAVSGPCAVRYF